MALPDYASPSERPSLYPTTRLFIRHREERQVAAAVALGHLAGFHVVIANATLVNSVCRAHGVPFEAFPLVAAASLVCMPGRLLPVPRI